MFERSVIPLGFIDDLLSLNEDSTFEKHYMGIYPTELELKKKIIAILLFLYIFFSYQFFNNFEWNVCVCVCVFAIICCVFAINECFVCFCACVLSFLLWWVSHERQAILSHWPATDPIDH